MLNQFFTSQLALVLFLFFIITSCTNKQAPNITELPAIQQSEALDHFFIQRAGPDGEFNYKAYKNALQLATSFHQEKGGPAGLDEDWTSRGPVNIGARINTIAVQPGNENIIYSGFSAGGIFKTTNHGQSWFPIFDDNAYLSIGDIAIDPNNPTTIYVGTGDPNISGYPFIGNGVYKSTDAGETWVNIGLQEQGIISKIIVHPDNPNIIYASAMGLPFIRNDKRGFYKSTDAGQTWTQMLFVSTDAGISDFVLSPTNPDVIYAASWNRIRNNHESIVAGPNANIFKSTNGGLTWNILETGLPQDEIRGRIGLAISTSNANKLYALYVNSSSQLDNIYQTTNGGASWSPTIDWESFNGLEGNPLAGFGWYFSQIRVNPQNDDEVYILGVNLWKSIDGGSNWDTAIPFTSLYPVHADKHDLVFTHTGDRLLATDGGLYRADETESDWIDIDNTPTTQFYRVAYNPHLPDWYFGGSQDNGSIGGESENTDWIRLYGGDGFQLIFNPDDPNITYAESQNGNISVSLEPDWSTWQVATNGIIGEDRRNWDMQFILSPHNPNTMYTGTYRVYKSTVGPIPEWTPVSDDLTDGQIYADRFHTITTIAESAAQQGLVYVGTTDGNVWRSDYGGDNQQWTKLSNDLPDEYVTAVVPSPDNIDKVYVSFSGYKENDNSPKLFKSANRGNSWQDISGDLPPLAINDIFILPMHNDSVITVATDGGVFITSNNGKNWFRLGNMPVIPVYDLAYNEVKDEIIAGTFARSIMTYSLDNINAFLSPTNELKGEKRNVLISPNPASTFLNIQIEGADFNHGITLLFYNLNGQKVHKQTLEYNNQKINISQLQTGIYLLNIMTSNKTIAIKKVVIN